jgi:hypothetical protein
MGGFFKRGEIVTVDGHPKRWRVDAVSDGYYQGEAVQIAQLSNEDQTETMQAVTDRLEKVAG